VRTLVTALLLLGTATAAAAQCPDGTPPPCGGAARPARAGTTSSVAVLYFDNLSRDTADAYLADGLTEQTIAQLGQVSRLTVASRYAVRRYRGAAQDPAAVGRSLGVSHLVTGSVQRAGRRVRVSVELVRAATGLRVWGQQYDRTDADLLDVQDEIAASVATGIVGRLLPEERRELATRGTRSGPAYDRFLRGTFLLGQRTEPAALRALSEYQDAIRFDPRFAAAHARLALTAGIALDWGWDLGATRDSLLRLGLAASQRAIALDSLDAESWLAHGYMLAHRDPIRFEGVMPALRRAARLDPRNAEVAHQLGWFHYMFGEDREAIAEFARAIALEPGRAISYEHIGRVHLTAGRFAEARPWFDSAVAADPGNLVFRMQRGQAAAATGDTAQARRDAVVLPAALGPETPPYLVINRAVILARLGDSSDVRALAEQLESSVAAIREPATTAAYGAAVVFVVAGRHDAALDILERARPRGLRFLRELAYPVFDPIRGHARFQRVLTEPAP
jgi:TolB-like protein/Tfp pilus assembly protein PilF